MAAQMTRLTDSGAFTGASASLPRKRAELPGVVGPVAGNVVAKLDDDRAPMTIAPMNILRTAILTITSIWRLVCLRFSKIWCDRQAQFLSQSVGEPELTNKRLGKGTRFIPRDVARVKTLV